MDPLRHWERRWQRLCSALGASTAAAPWGERLQGLYGEPHRAYHDGSHLAHCLETFDRYQEHAERPAEVELALWFHDAIHDPAAPDNEVRSAALLEEFAAEAALDPAVAARAAALVLATRHETEPASPDARLTVDCDLAILGTEAERFERYEEAIRREYAWVPDDAFAVARARVLRQFLDRPSVFLTEPFRRSSEARARENLERAVERWRR